MNSRDMNKREKVKAGSLLKITQMDELYLLRHAGVEKKIQAISKAFISLRR